MRALWCAAVMLAAMVMLGVAEDADTTRLLRRVRLLRAQLRSNREKRRSLERERNQLERSIVSKRALIDDLRDGAADDAEGGADDATEEELAVLVRREKRLRGALTQLAAEAERLAGARNATLGHLQSVNFEHIIERHARGLPPAMQGALRKSALVLTPFFDTLLTAADTNNRLVNHVGAEIDKYTHVNIGESPFMSGLLFYCILLVPALTLLLLVRSVIDSSTKWSVSHLIILGNIYFIALCVILTAAALLQREPMKLLYVRHERFVIVTNLALALYYVWFLWILGLQTLYSWDNRNLAQLVGATSVAIHYFLFAWRRVFTDKPPQLFVHSYLIYATIFAFITYDRCLRINARWFTDCGLARRIRAMDATIPLVGIWQSIVKHVRRQFTTIAAYVSTAFQKPRRWKRRSRRNNAQSNRTSTTHSESSSPARETRSTRARRSAMRSDFEVETSESEESLFSDSEDEARALYRPLLMRPGALKVSRGGLLSSRSRSRSASWNNDTDSSSNPGTWWWARANDEQQQVENDRVDRPKNEWGVWHSAKRMFAWNEPKEVRWEDISSRTKTVGRRSKYERSNARPRRDRDTQRGLSLWKWS